MKKKTYNKNIVLHSGFEWRLLENKQIRLLKYQPALGSGE